MTKAARKTVEVGTLLHRLNYFLASKNSTDEERKVIAAFVEGILFDTGNYRGFGYLPQADYPNETNGLESRRHYYVSTAVENDYAAAQALIQKHYIERGL